MKKNPLYKSFDYAFEGIFSSVKKERNMKIHLGFIIAVVVSGIFFKISRSEWIVCLLLFAIVGSLELVNTAIEATVDLVTEEKRPLAKLAKDAAAGAVLFSAIIAAVIGLIIFLPRGLEFVQHWI